MLSASSPNHLLLLSFVALWSTRELAGLFLMAQDSSCPVVATSSTSGIAADAVWGEGERMRAVQEGPGSSSANTASGAFGGGGGASGAEEPRRFALVLFGGVSRLYKSDHAKIYDETGTEGGGERRYTYTPMAVTSGSLVKHLVDVNGGPGLFDLFVHSWNADLEANYTKEFRGCNPVWSLYEDNDVYEGVYKPQMNPERYDDNWRMMSFSVSLARGAMAVLQHSRQNNRKEGGNQLHTYERVVFIRPDIILTKDIDFADERYAPSPEVVHVDRHPHGNGDFYFIASSLAAVEQMARLPLDVHDPRKPVEIHGFIQKAFNDHGFQFRMDRVLPGRDVEVWRKLCLAGFMMGKGFEFYHANYGVSQAMWDEVSSLCSR